MEAIFVEIFNALKTIIDAYFATDLPATTAVVAVNVWEYIDNALIELAKYYTSVIFFG